MEAGGEAAAWVMVNTESSEEACPEIPDRDQPGPAPQPASPRLGVDVARRARSRGLRLLAEEPQGRKLARVCGTGPLA